jgi:hypothetical protein
MAMFVDALQGVGQCSVLTGRLSVDPGLEVVHQIPLACRWLIALQRIFVPTWYSRCSGRHGSEHSG